MTIDLLNKLKTPSFYNKTGEVEVHETAVSIVFLVGEFAYKFKKEVNFGFLDYSTLELRKKFCEQELGLNKKGAPDLYLEVLPVTKEGNDYTIGGDGEIVEYCVKMHRFDEDRLLLNLLKKDKLKTENILDLAYRIFEYHQTSESNKEISEFGKVGEVRKAFDQNFEQTEKYVGSIINQRLFDETELLTNRFFQDHENLFAKRVKNNKIKACHGDLHLNNICYFQDELQLFDCIEFNDSFRFVDVMYDIAFTTMDLDFNGRSDLARLLLDEYTGLSNDDRGLEILPIYQSRQAYVRAKVISFQTDQMEDQKLRNEKIEVACKYYELALKYVS